MRARLVPGLVITLVAVAALSGCSALVPHTLSASQRPSVGDCWKSTFDTAQNAASWSSGGAVPCLTSHQLYTYAVVNVKSTKKWQGKDGDVNGAIQGAAYRACNEKLSDFIDVPDNGRLVPYFFVAPEAQWNKGAKWARCDIGVLRTGSLYEHPDLARLPPNISTLVKQAQTTPDLFGTCVTTTDLSGDTGPLDDPKATIADCVHDYQWQYESSFSIQQDSYPTDDQFNTLGQQHCGDGADEAGRGWTIYVPSEKNFDDGDITIDCWYYAPDGAPQT
jgi:hypothetical protein